MKSEIKELRNLYEDIHVEIKELVAKRRGTNPTSYQFDNMSGQIKGLNEAQRLINRRVRIINKSKEEEKQCCT